MFNVGSVLYDNKALIQLLLKVNTKLKKTIQKPKKKVAESLKSKKSFAKKYCTNRTAK